VSFELHPGEIIGYLGPNGSGKSTTVNLVVGLLEPSAGDITLGGVRASEDPPHTPLLFDDDLPMDVNPLRLSAD
jgi:ABC-type multidrug transport system ATPase subunit